jgi:DNA-binding CsgD family transcriptional regulator
MGQRQQLRAEYEIASTVARRETPRGRPRRRPAGRHGTITASSASVVSLAYRSPFRRYSDSVISVQAIVASVVVRNRDGIIGRRNHSAYFLFGRLVTRLILRSTAKGKASSLRAYRKITPKEASTTPLSDQLEANDVTNRQHPRIAKQRPQLTAREKQVLGWLALGKSAFATAVILEISVFTVRLHIQSIKRKLDATNVPHAVTQAYHAGILDRTAPPPS